MAYEAKVLADSVSPAGVRLTTMQVTFPRIVLAEFNTHRVLSRNSASSRAIPVEKRIAAIEADPFVPAQFAKNRRGMQSTEVLEERDAEYAEREWRGAARDACERAHRLAVMGVHKALANRLVEPFCWHTVIVSATEWSNFFALRCHPDAQPEIRTVAEMMRDLYAAHEPVAVDYGDWHRPLLDRDEDFNLAVAGVGDGDEQRGMTADELNLVSVGRCARVSSLTHDGRRDPAEDVALARRLLHAGHMSPFEHVARPTRPELTIGNFRGWEQYRKTIKNEHNFGLILESRRVATQSWRS